MSNEGKARLLSFKYLEIVKICFDVSDESVSRDIAGEAMICDDGDEARLSVAWYPSFVTKINFSWLSTCSDLYSCNTATEVRVCHLFASHDKSLLIPAVNIDRAA